MAETDKAELDAALETLSKEKGTLVYGVLWSSGRPYLVQADPHASIGIES